MLSNRVKRNRPLVTVGAFSKSRPTIILSVILCRLRMMTDRGQKETVKC